MSYLFFCVKVGIVESKDEVDRARCMMEFNVFEI